MSNQTFSSLALTFQPLNTSSGGLYTCLATLPSPAVAENITANTSHEVIVKSTFLYFGLFSLISVFNTPPTVSRPIVVITADGSGTAGKPHEFVCSITVPTAVNTSTTANVTWFGPGVGSGRDSSTFTMAVDDSNMSTSTLQLSPLRTSDAGLYYCSVILSSAVDSAFITPSAAGHDSQLLNVTGKYYHS